MSREVYEENKTEGLSPYIGRFITTLQVLMYITYSCIYVYTTGLAIHAKFYCGNINTNKLSTLCPDLYLIIKYIK